MRDFAPVALLTRVPLVLVVHPALPATTVAEFIAHRQAARASLAYASSGNGQSTHLAAELFKSMTGVPMVHVPYKGSAPALVDVAGGQVAAMFDTMLSALPQVKAGRLRALAVTSARRSAAAPELPTIAESGVAGYEATAWNGLLAPAGTPREIVEALHRSRQRDPRPARRRPAARSRRRRSRHRLGVGFRGLHPGRDREVGEGRQEFGRGDELRSLR